MWRASLALVAILAGCSQASGGNDPTETGRTKYHMRQQFSDLRTIERMLVAGKLEEAKALAFLLKPFGEVAQTAEAREVTLAVGALRNARTLDDAIYAEVRVGASCAHCHVKAQKLPVFKAPSSAPPDRPAIAAQMARHQWAVDRIWEGLIAASDEHWRAGLYVLATSPLPRSSTHAPQLATRLQEQARAALEAGAMSVDGRASAYGAILVTCKNCHATPVKPQQP